MRALRWGGRVAGAVLAVSLLLTASVAWAQPQPTTGTAAADLVVTVASQQLVAPSSARLGIICWNQGVSPNAIRVGFGATPTATTGYFLQWGTGFTDTGTYAINVIRDTGATGNPTISCGTVSR
jgi:hypothetical protein